MHLFGVKNSDANSNFALKIQCYIYNAFGNSSRAVSETGACLIMNMNKRKENNSNKKKHP